MNRQTQAEQILQAIKSAGQDGIENWRLVQFALKYSSRISELRRDGYDIRQRRVYKDGKASGTHVYYLNETPSSYVERVNKIYEDHIKPMEAAVTKHTDEINKLLQERLF